MKRKFNDSERIATEKNVKHNESLIKDIQEALSMKKLIVEKLTPYNRRIEDKQAKDEIESMNLKIETLKKTNEIAKNQLKYGVEMRTPPGV